VQINNPDPEYQVSIVRESIKVIANS